MRGVYAQDEWRATKNLKLTMGMRFDVPIFDSTGFVNPIANSMTFRDENNSLVQLQDPEAAQQQ